LYVLLLDWRKGVVCIDAQEDEYDHERFLLLLELQMGGRDYCLLQNVSII
jgi:hypothetical protein